MTYISFELRACIWLDRTPRTTKVIRLFLVDKIRVFPSTKSNLTQHKEKQKAVNCDRLIKTADFNRIQIDISISTMPFEIDPASANFGTISAKPFAIISCNYFKIFPLRNLIF